MTDHPTRRLPDDERPAYAAGRGPNRCRWCAGEVRAFPTATGQGGGFALQVSNPAHPPAGWLVGPPMAPIFAQVCLECGYTELYTEQPWRLLGDR
jgi:hypothetical protein